MPNEFEKVIASLLKPKASAGQNENVEKLTTLDESMNVTDSITAVTSTPERRVGFAIIGLSEVA